MANPCHPAPYSAPILELMRDLIPSGSYVLDPFAGTGRIHQLADAERSIRTVGVEIEPEWAALHPDTICGDATRLPADWSDTFDVLATSPCYGNRFADSHTAKDGSTRRSYTHDLRAFTDDPERKLAANSAGRLHWGQAYRDLHEKAWAEAWRVVKPGGRLILNVSDHVRGGQLQHVPEWHLVALEGVGFHHCGTHFVETRRQKHGANRERADHEEVQLYRKPLARGSLSGPGEARQEGGNP